MKTLHGNERSFRSSLRYRWMIWKHRFYMSMAIAMLALLVLAGFTVYNKMVGLPGVIGNWVTTSSDWVGELFSSGGERTFSSVELHGFYRTTLSGESVLGHSYGIYQADGFQFIDGPGWEDNENIVLWDAGYLGQAHVPTEGVVFERSGTELLVRIPAAEYFTTTLAIEPTIENNRESFAALGQAFGTVTDTRQARIDLKSLVDEAARNDDELLLMAECKAAEALTRHILPGFFQARSESMPTTIVVSSSGEQIDSQACYRLAVETGGDAVSLDGLELPVHLQGAGRIADSDVGSIDLPPIDR